jgi:hypothetical protein
MTKTQTHAEVKLCKDGKIADYEKFILPGKLTRQEVKAILKDQYGYEVVSFRYCISQTSK